MFKWLVIALVLGFLFTSASAFSEVESYEDTLPILQEFGENLYQTLVTGLEFTSNLVDIWQGQEVVED